MFRYTSGPVTWSVNKLDQKDTFHFFSLQNLVYFLVFLPPSPPSSESGHKVLYFITFIRLIVFLAVIIIIMATTATISISVCSQIGMMVASINPPLDPPFGQPDQYVTPQHHHQYHHHHHQDHHHIITNLPIRVKERPRSCCMRRCARLSVPLKVQIFSE